MSCHKTVTGDVIDVRSAFRSPASITIESKDRVFISFVNVDGKIKKVIY